MAGRLTVTPTRTPLFSLDLFAFIGVYRNFPARGSLSGCNVRATAALSGRLRDIDLASLLQDARVDVAEATELALLGRYLRRRRAADADFDGAQFIKLYVTLAAQRASKILGIFARLDARDGKPQYLRHMPRIWGYLQRSLAHPALAPLNTWYGENIPPWPQS